MTDRERQIEDILEPHMVGYLEKEKDEEGAEQSGTEVAERGKLQHFLK